MTSSSKPSISGWRARHSAFKRRASSRSRAASARRSGPPRSSRAAARASFSLAWASNSSSMTLLRRDRGGGAVQRRGEGVPRQAGAFHPHRKFRNAAEGGQLAQLVGIAGRGEVAGDQGVEALKQHLRLGRGLALERLGQQRGGSGGNRAAGAL